MRMSALQPISQDTMSILERAGSRGNSTIRRPVGVRAPKNNLKKKNNGTIRCVKYKKHTRYINKGRAGT